MEVIPRKKLKKTLRESVKKDQPKQNGRTDHLVKIHSDHLLEDQYVISPIIPPSDAHVDEKIKKMAEHVAQFGIDFEELVKEKERSNPAFDFLYSGGRQYTYYKFLRDWNIARFSLEEKKQWEFNSSGDHVKTHQLEWKCPAGHSLQPSRDSYYYDCDVCKVTNLKKTPEGLLCSVCDFDVCPECTMKGPDVLHLLTSKCQESLLETVFCGPEPEIPQQTENTMILIGSHVKSNDVTSFNCTDTFQKKIPQDQLTDFLVQDWSNAWNLLMIKMKDFDECMMQKLNYLLLKVTQHQCFHQKVVDNASKANAAASSKLKEFTIKIQKQKRTICELMIELQLVKSIVDSGNKTCEEMQAKFEETTTEILKTAQGKYDNLARMFDAKNKELKEATTQVNEMSTLAKELNQQLQLAKHNQELAQNLLKESEEKYDSQCLLFVVKKKELRALNEAQQCRINQLENELESLRPVLKKIKEQNEMLEKKEQALKEKILQSAEQQSKMQHISENFVLLQKQYDEQCSKLEENLTELEAIRKAAEEKTVNTLEQKSKILALSEELAPLRKKYVDVCARLTEKSLELEAIKKALNEKTELARKKEVDLTKKDFELAAKKEKLQSCDVLLKGKRLREQDLLNQLENLKEDLRKKSEELRSKSETLDILQQKLEVYEKQYADKLLTVSKKDKGISDERKALRDQLENQTHKLYMWKRKNDVLKNQLQEKLDGYESLRLETQRHKTHSEMLRQHIENINNQLKTERARTEEQKKQILQLQQDNENHIYVWSQKHRTATDELELLRKKLLENESILQRRPLLVSTFPQLSKLIVEKIRIDGSLRVAVKFADGQICEGSVMGFHAQLGFFIKYNDGDEDLLDLEQIERYAIDSSIDCESNAAVKISNTQSIVDFGTEHEQQGMDEVSNSQNMPNLENPDKQIAVVQTCNCSCTFDIQSNQQEQKTVEICDDNLYATKLESAEEFENFNTKWGLFQTFSQYGAQWNQLAFHRKLFKKLKRQIGLGVAVDPEPLEFVARRENVVESVMNSSIFNSPQDAESAAFQDIQVSYDSLLGDNTVRELGFDEGGLSRELYTLFWEQLEVYDTADKSFVSKLEHEGVLHRYRKENIIQGDRVRLFVKEDPQSLIFFPVKFCNLEGEPIELTSNLLNKYETAARFMVRTIIESFELEVRVPSAFASNILVDYFLDTHRRYAKKPLTEILTDILAFSPEYSWILLKLDGTHTAAEILGPDAGHNMPLNDEIAFRKCLTMFVELHIITPRKQQLEAMSKGFRLEGAKNARSFSIHPFLEVCSRKELRHLISGEEKDLSPEMIMQITTFQGFGDDETEMKGLFLVVLQQMDQAQIRQFLTFVTGQPFLSTRIPERHQTGITVELDPGECNRLPTSSSCFKLLKLPRYKTAEDMEIKLKKAIQQRLYFNR